MKHNIGYFYIFTCICYYRGLIISDRKQGYIGIAMCEEVQLIVIKYAMILQRKRTAFMYGAYILDKDEKTK